MSHASRPADPPIDPADTDPRRLRWMQGFPPPPERQVRFDVPESVAFPASRWLLSHARELMPTVNVWRGRRPALPLPAAARPLDDLAFVAHDGEAMTLRRLLAESFTDGLIVLHDGRVLFEHYAGALAPHLPHRCFSVTKSFTGLLAAMLVDEGRLDPTQPATALLPELAGSAWADATLRQVMDMTVDVAFDERYDVPDGDVVRYRRANGSLPRPDGYAGPRSIFEVLPTLRKAGPHGHAFHYVTPNTEVLGYTIERLTGQPLAEQISERLWQRLGMEEDAHLVVDPLGHAHAGGGLCCTLRDLARFGEAIRQDGRAHGEQVLRPGAIADIRRGGDAQQFERAGWDWLPGWTYRNMWWLSHGTLQATRALGVHGQQLFVSAPAGLTIVRFGSQPVAVDERIEQQFDAAFSELARTLNG